MGHTYTSYKQVQVRVCIHACTQHQPEVSRGDRQGQLVGAFFFSLLLSGHKCITHSQTHTRTHTLVRLIYTMAGMDYFFFVADFDMWFLSCRQKRWRKIKIKTANFSPKWKYWLKVIVWLCKDRSICFFFWNVRWDTHMPIRSVRKV